MSIFLNPETQPIVRAALLQPTPLNEPQILDPITAYSSSQITVKQISTPHGLQDAIVETVTNKKVVVLIQHNTHTLLSQAHRYAIEATTWELPYAYVKEDENALEAVLRLIRELTTQTVPAETIIPLGTIHQNSELISTHTETYLYNIEDIPTQNPNCETTIQYFNTEDIKKALTEAYIPDTTTTTVFYRAEHKNLLN